MSSRILAEIDGATVQELPGDVYLVIVNGRITPALAGTVDRAICSTREDTDFGVVLETGPAFEGYDPSMRESKRPQLSGLAAALVSERATLRMVVSAVSLMLPKSVAKIRTFESREEALSWVRERVAAAVAERASQA